MTSGKRGMTGKHGNHFACGCRVNSLGELCHSTHCRHEPYPSPVDGRWKLEGSRSVKDMIAIGTVETYGLDDVLWEYEDQLSPDWVSEGMARASRVIDGVRMYPYRLVGEERAYIGEDEG